MITVGNEENFNSLIDKEMVLVDFYADWCGPCKMLSPILQDLASDRSSVEIVKIDVDSNPNLAKRYGVMSIPTMLLFKNGSLVSQKNGFMPKEEISSWIEENR